jgi:thiamine-phosphate pyrophosphorylase
MLPRQPRAKARRTVPTCWLMLDARLGHDMATIVATMPPRSAVIVRPYAMETNGRAKTIRQIRHIARAKRHLLLLAGPGSIAGYDGRHGNSFSRPGTSGQFRSQVVHHNRQLRRAEQQRADAVLISPIWPTRSHEGAPVLGRRGFSRFAAAASGKAIALGGMTADRFRALRAQGAKGWAAIDAWRPSKTHRP